MINHFKPRINELCEDCQKRFEKNPLRVLDCKVDSNHVLMKNAPKTLDYLNVESKNRFEKLKSYLESLEIEYKVDTNLVRGLDYYSHTVFEIQADIEGFGSQNTICGGGRYNNLVETLDGPSTPGMGFGMGLERLILALDAEEIELDTNKRLDLFIANISSEPEEVFAIVQDVRLNGFTVETDYLDKNLKGQFKEIERLNPKYFIVIGDDELKSGQVKIKDNDTKEEESITIDEIINFLDVR